MVLRTLLRNTENGAKKSLDFFRPMPLTDYVEAASFGRHSRRSKATQPPWRQAGSDSAARKRRTQAYGEDGQVSGERTVPPKGELSQAAKLSTVVT